jgi:hypothetical protein
MPHKKLMCEIHKTKGMKNKYVYNELYKSLRNNKSQKSIQLCNDCGNSNAYYALTKQDFKTKRYCKDCKTNEMIDNHHNICLADGCNKQSNYYVPDTNLRTCREHGTEESISYKKRKTSEK